MKKLLCFIIFAVITITVIPSNTYNVQDDDDKLMEDLKKVLDSFKDTYILKSKIFDVEMEKFLKEKHKSLYEEYTDYSSMFNLCVTRLFLYKDYKEDFNNVQFLELMYGDMWIYNNIEKRLFEIAKISMELFNKEK
ncbi:hypothetical protein EZS27_008308 [termite gut metagenome]|uniref:Uncharacterized protein n=1 Tax=termite gut metagenome TaxID=433724 RepID=A0A5J4SFH1_9ZZZZ